MPCPVLVPAGARRPGPRHLAPTRREAGSVTVEAAVALLGVTVVLVAVVWCVGVLAAQLALGEAARAGARSAARGDADTAVVAEVRRLVADADVVVSSSDGHVVVLASRTAAPPGLAVRLGGIRLSARAVAAQESP